MRFNHREKSEPKEPIVSEEQALEDIKVALRPILGFSPRFYVPLLWLLGMATLFFLFLLLPGIRKNGTYLTVWTSPPGASVLVDGKRLGPSGEPLFIPRGSHNLLLRRPGFLDDQGLVSISGRIFASRLRPRQESINVRLSAEKGFQPLVRALSEYAAWASTGPERGNYAITSALTKGARDLLGSGKSSDAAQELLEDALPLSRDARQLADLLRAETLILSEGAPLGIQSLSQLFQIASENLDRQPSLLKAALTSLDQAELASWDLLSLKAEEQDYWEEIIRRSQEMEETAPHSSAEILNLGGADFLRIRESRNTPMGDLEVVAEGYNPRSGANPQLVWIETYALALEEVSNRTYANFIQANPQWAAENRQALMETDQVDSGYLRSWTAQGPPEGQEDFPITEISWYAAQAFTTWWDQAVLQSSNWKAQLPNEDQWEQAARLNKALKINDEQPLRAVSLAQEGILGLKGMMGNVREWCENPYRYNESRYREPKQIFSSQDKEKAFLSPDRAIRGAAHIDQKIPYPASLRGALAAERTSPVIGFRLALIPRN